MLTERKPHSASRWMCTGSKYARSSMYWMCRDQDNDTAAKDICFAKKLCHHADELVLAFVLLHKRCPGAPKRRHVIQKAAVEGVVVYTIYTYALIISKAFWTKLEYPCLACHLLLSQILIQEFPIFWWGFVQGMEKTCVYLLDTQGPRGPFSGSYWSFLGNFDTQSSGWFQTFSIFTPILREMIQID